MKVLGLRELNRALGELPKATGRNVLKRTLTKVATPIAEDMRAMAPDDPATDGMDLKGSIGVGTKLTRAQAREHRKANGGGARKTAEGWKRDPKTSFEMFAGAGGVPQAHMQEFGTDHHAPQPFARPAWDANKRGALETVKDELWAEISRAAARLARKSAKGT